MNVKIKQFDRMDSNYQRKVNDLVSREVLLNISFLMQTLHSNEDICLGDYEDELLNIRGSYDCYEPIADEINNSDNDTFKDYLDWINDESITTKQGLIDHLTNLGHGEAFCDYANIEPDYNETLEYWVVSDWFGGQLSKQGENVLDILNMRVWGRTCSGQSISIDGVVCDIYENLNS